MADLWNDDNPITRYGIHVPARIEQAVTPYDVAAITQGGCASGAYMPAVTYHQAIATMAVDGDDVLDYITDNMGELPAPRSDESWSGMAVFYLSVAVELWASAVEGELETAIDDTARFLT